MILGINPNGPSPRFPSYLARSSAEQSNLLNQYLSKYSQESLGVFSDEKSLSQNDKQAKNGLKKDDA
jgi:hypothetical protein